ncbi:MAG TPA: hypothetical protein VIF57_15485 [Polyangia bacterium]|jgi:hypothetical protein
MRNLRGAIGVLVTMSVAAASAGGCGNDGKDVVVHNQGDLCVYPTSEPNAVPFGADTTARDYAAGEVANLMVFFGCLSGSCTSDRQGSCTATQNGDVISVDATATYHDTGAHECTADCAYLLARCTTEPLAAGTFTFSFTGAETQLAVPSTVAPPCIRQP